MLWLGVLALLALGQPAAAKIAFLPDSAPAFGEWRAAHREWFDGRCAFTLSVGGMHALDSGILLLFGDVDAVGPYRSLLARSEDGGRSWAEVMSPSLGSAVLGVSFISARDGRALVGWEVEGPGALLLYATRDAGRTWRHASEVPKPHHLDVPLKLTCAGARCIVPLDCPVGDGAVHLLETPDGGRSWLRNDAAGSLAERKPQSGGTTTAVAEWQARESDDGSTVGIMRRSSGETAWTIVSVLGRHLERSPDGRFTVCVPAEASREAASHWPPRRR